MYVVRTVYWVQRNFSAFFFLQTWARTEIYRAKHADNVNFISQHCSYGISWLFRKPPYAFAHEATSWKPWTKVNWPTTVVPVARSAALFSLREAEKRKRYKKEENVHTWTHARTSWNRNPQQAGNQQSNSDIAKREPTRRWKSVEYLGHGSRGEFTRRSQGNQCSTWLKFAI